MGRSKIERVRGDRSEVSCADTDAAFLDGVVAVLDGAGLDISGFDRVLEAETLEAPTVNA